MATYGGDSWVPEAKMRVKRRDELILQQFPNNEYKKLSNGKLACLVCPSFPVVDTPQILLVHRTGAKHAFEQNKRTKQTMKLTSEYPKRKVADTSWQSKENKPSSVTPTFNEKAGETPSLTSMQKIPQIKPYVSKRMKAVKLEDFIEEKAVVIGPELPRKGNSQFKSCPWMLPSLSEVALSKPEGKEKFESNLPKNLPTHEENPWKLKALEDIYWIQKGWKKDSKGNWCKDENVEFDSDEEGPQEKTSIS